MRKRYKNEIGHRHPIAKCLSNMKERCYNKKDKQYPEYGGRGITIYAEWMEDTNEFYKWALTNGWAKGLTIDRIKNDKGYYPDNCRFVTQKVNARNRRNTKLIEIDGVKKTIGEWGEIANLHYRTIQIRLRAGWSGNELLKKGKAKKTKQ